MDNLITLHEKVSFEVALKARFNEQDQKVELVDELKEKIQKSHQNFLSWMEKDVPIYGVTTGFGEGCYRTISKEQSSLLQNNLISYLMIGTGKFLSEEVCRSVLFFRLISLSKGFSGVSPELINKLKELYELKISPVIPREGSLGASGDLIPLAYLANTVRGQGEVYYQGEIVELTSLCEKGIYSPYSFKAKEGLALVNGTTTMTALCFHNYKKAKFLTDLASLATSWLCMAVQGRKEAFGKLVNAQSKQFEGQAKSASTITALLQEEDYKSISYGDIRSENGLTTEFVQDPYSLRCAPQVLGPIHETLEQIKNWLELEINGVSDNPLFDTEENIANGGNFYGGYLTHSMDYLKISMGNLADLMDRQLTMLISDKTNRGLPQNLVDRDSLSEDEKNLYHGLKGCSSKRLGHHK